MPIGHRAIGVVYRPEYEQYGNYVPSIIPDRYDAFLHFDHTQALHPLLTADLTDFADRPPAVAG